MRVRVRVRVRVKGSAKRSWSGRQRHITGSGTDAHHGASNCSLKCLG